MNEIEEMTEETTEIRTIFSFPQKIKQVKIGLAIAQIISGIVFLVIPIVYFVIQDEKTVPLNLLAILALIVATVLIFMFPTNLAKAINSTLILGENKVKIRNSFNWKEIPWKDVQDVLITEKLSNDPASNVTIGASIIRFRTISKGHYFFVDSYPKEDVNEMKESIKEIYTISVSESGYTIKEKVDRPSLRTRFTLYEKVAI